MTLEELARKAGYRVEGNVDDTCAWLTATPNDASRAIRHVCVLVSADRSPAAAAELAVDGMRRALAEQLAEQSGTFVSPPTIAEAS